jgi:hypothetical protein
MTSSVIPEDELAEMKTLVPEAFIEHVPIA